MIWVAALSLLPCNWKVCLVLCALLGHGGENWQWTCFALGAVRCPAPGLLVHPSKAHLNKPAVQSQLVKHKCHCQRMQCMLATQTVADILSEKDNATTRASNTTMCVKVRQGSNIQQQTTFGLQMQTHNNNAWLMVMYTSTSTVIQGCRSEELNSGPQVQKRT